MFNAMYVAYCEECCGDPTDDPITWCDCRGDERCSGRCRHRAHTPERCPTLTLGRSWPIIMTKEQVSEDPNLHVSGL